jgi:pimeloyl-ACP methyl ester carboxylesterase
MQRLVLLCLLFLLAACVSRVPAVDERQRTASMIAREGGFASAVLQASGFAIQSFARGQADALTIYIEGDGFAWESRTRPSSDPTPINPLALRLAASDRSPAVAYLARPCQYVAAPGCHRRYWGTARFADEIIAAMDEAVSAAKADAGAERVHLVGFSGGAAVAALLAARRADVTSLRTVAGYLDPVRLNAFHGVSPLDGSLDPMTVAPALAAIPQLHFSGSEDGLIPSWVADGFVAAQGAGACASASVVEGAGHASGWVEAWPQLLAACLALLGGKSTAFSHWPCVAGLVLATPARHTSCMKRVSAPDSPLVRRIARTLRRAAAFAFVERLWPRLVLAGSVLGLFLAISWLGLWPLMPDLLRLALLAVLGLALVGALIWAARTPKVTRGESLQRVEHASGLEGRPLAALDDAPFDTDNPQGRALWQAHQARMAAKVKHLAAGLPAPRTELFDRWALRAPVLLVLVVAFFVAGPQRLERIEEAFAPIEAAPACRCASMSGRRRRPIPACRRAPCLPMQAWRMRPPRPPARCCPQAAG